MTTSSHQQQGGPKVLSRASLSTCHLPPLWASRATGLTDSRGQPNKLTFPTWCLQDFPSPTPRAHCCLYLSTALPSLLPTAMLSFRHSNLHRLCHQEIPPRTLLYLARLSKTLAPGPNSTFPATSLLPKAFDLSQIRTHSFHQHRASSFLHSTVGYRRPVHMEAYFQGSTVLRGSEMGMLIATQCKCYRNVTDTVLWEETKEGGLPGRPRKASCKVASNGKKHTMEDTSPVACRGGRQWVCLGGTGGGQRCHRKPTTPRPQLASLRTGESGNGLPFQQSSQMFHMGSSVIFRKSKGGQIVK